MMKSSYWRSIILSTISAGMVAGFFYYVYINADKYRALLRLSIPDVTSLFILSLLFPVLGGISNAHLFRSMGADISYQDGIFLAAASTLANQLPISGGIVSKGVYLKRKHDISYAKFFSATAALFFCYLSVNGLIGISILLYRAAFQNFPIPPVLLIGFSLMAACLSVFLLPVQRIKIPEKIRAIIYQSIEGWTLLNKKTALLFQLIVMQMTMMALLAARYWLAFRMLSQSITFEQAMLFSTASLLTQLVSIAPGGLGVREAIVGTVASALGFETGASIVAVGLDRLISTLGILLAGGIGIVVLGKKISEPVSETTGMK